MGRGRPPKPTALHILNGNPRQRSAAELIAKAETEAGVAMSPDTPPPDHLSEGAKEIWQELARPLAESGFLATADMTLFGNLCEMEADRRAAEKELRKQKLFEVVNGNLVRNPMLRTVRELRNDCKKMFVEFGLSPSSRTKVTKTKGSKTKSNPFKELAEKKVSGQ